MDSEEGVTDIDESKYKVVKEELDEDDYTYKTSLYRWLILFSFMLVMMASNFCQTSFASTSEVIAKVYGVSGMVVNTCVALFYVAYLFLLIPVIWWMDNYGTLYPIKICAILMIVGAWGRYVILERTENFALVILP